VVFVDNLGVLFYIVSAVIGGALLWAAALYIATIMENVLGKH
jgi:hypothetical protein